MWFGYGGHMGWMWLWWLAGLAILIAFVWAVLRAGGTASPRAGDDSPEAILKRRYARGDMSRDEYEQKLTDLRK